MAVILQLVVVYIFCLNFVVQSEEIDGKFFLNEIINKYGINGSISYKGFEQLYQSLGVGPSSSKVAASSSNSGSSKQLFSNLNDYQPKKELAQAVDNLTVLSSSISSLHPHYCLSASQLLNVYGATESNNSISPLTFLHLCAAIIYQLDQHHCSQPPVHHHKNSVTIMSWIYAIVSVIIITVAGLLCVALVRPLQKTCINRLISFLVALAAGTLLGDALLHLIPHALANEEGSHGHSHSHGQSVICTVLMFLSAAVLFTLEAIIKHIKTGKEEDKTVDNNIDNRRYIPVSCDNGDKELEMKEMIKDQSHGHGHSHSSSNTIPMIIFGDALHNFIDGLAIGGAFAGSTGLGFATSLAILTHELPHELGDFAVLLQCGMSVSNAFMSNFLVSIPSLFGAIIGLTVGNFGTSWIYAITAGTFIYIALANLVPEINKEHQDRLGILIQVVGFLSGGVIMGAIALIEDALQHFIEDS